MTREQLARDIIEAGIDLLACADHEGNDPQTLTAGDLVFVSNMIRDHVLAAVKWKNEKIATLESSLDAALEGRAELIGSEKTLRDKLETRSMLLEAAQAGNRLLADGLLELKAKLADVVLVIQGEIDPADLDTLATRRETARRRREDPHYCPHGKTLPSCHYCAMESDPPCPPETQNPGPSDEDLASGPQFPPSRCPHGILFADGCNACDVAGDLAFDAAREDRNFNR